MSGRGWLTSLGVLVAALVLAVPAGADAPVSNQGNITVEATSPDGATVSFTAADSEGDTCTPASGTLFAIGADQVVGCQTPDTTPFTFTVTVLDPAPPVITVPDNMTVTVGASASGAEVSYTAPAATDNFDGTDPVTCSHSGSTFPIGMTTVNCTATDAAGHTGSASFTVTVNQDITPPTITTPDNPLVEATGPGGASVSYTATVSDPDDTPTVGCFPSSGSTFPLGPTPVNCTAHDTHDNTSAASFTVTVRDTTAPVIGSVPADITANAGTLPAGAVVTFTNPSATDAVDGTVAVTCSLASGSTFPYAASTVNCSASDHLGHTSTASFKVTVNDTTPPVIAVPTPIVTQAASSTGAVVSYGATALDVVDGVLTPKPTCLPVSGSSFAVGVTTVTCNAKDKAGNAATSQSFTVTVTAPPADGSPPPATTTTAPFTPPVVRKPQAVSNFTVNPGDRRVVVVWKLPAGDSLHVELLRAIGGGSPKTIYSGTSLSFADTRLINGRRYSYSIVVVDADGNRSDSVSKNATPNALPLVAPAAGARVTSPPTLRWVPAAKATYYNVQLFRNNHKILSIWPGSNRVTLKQHWVFGGRAFTLSAGQYRWYVWPGFGPHRDRKYGKVLGSSTFQVAG